MIFLAFVIEIALILGCAYLSGGIFSFVNPDSILVVLIGFILSAFVMSIGKKKALLKGLKEIFTFKKVEKDKDVKNMFAAISIMTLAFSLASTAQGLFSASFITDMEANSPAIYTNSQIICLASFSTVYAIIFIGLLLVPVIYLNKD